MTALNGICSPVKTYSDHSIIRANISKYIDHHKWLVCIDSSNKSHGNNDAIFYENDGKIRLSNIEVWGFNARGNIFKITGDTKTASSDLLSLDSYVNASIMFSTDEGYLYMCNTNDGLVLFEHHLDFKVYNNIIQKFKLFPFYETVNAGPLSFQLLKNNPDFYDKVVSLPMPKSIYHNANPDARLITTGMFLGRQHDSPVLNIRKVIDKSPAFEAGIQAGDLITQASINGVNLQSLDILNIQSPTELGIINLKIERNLPNNRLLIFNTNVFIPSPLEVNLIPPS